MAKIKNDHFGVVYARKGGQIVKLRAGDTVPSGVKVREELLAPAAKGGARGKSDAGSDTE